MITFDTNKQAIFDPPSLNLVGDINKAIMIFDDEVWEDYIVPNKELKTLPVKNLKGKVFNTFRIYQYNNQDILLIYPETGGAASAADLELLIASGIKKIVAFGTCGAMDKDIAKNTIIIPISAIREEGVSYHYLPPSDEVEQNPNSVDVMKNIFIQNNIEFIVGKVWTTDAVYRETAEKLKSYKENGCKAVDMELASLLAVAKFRNIDFAQFLITDDNIDGKNDIENNRCSKKIVNIALQIVDKL